MLFRKNVGGRDFAAAHALLLECQADIADLIALGWLEVPGAYSLHFDASSQTLTASFEMLPPVGDRHPLLEDLRV